MKDLNKLFKECVDIVTKDCGIEIGDIISVELNYRAKGRFGQCVSCGNGRYKLNFNHLIFDDRSDENAVKETIIHEILHTCKGCHGHKGQWKTLAICVSMMTPYQITRTSSYEHFGLDRPEQCSRTKNANYVFKCEGCGQKIIRQRVSKFVKHPERYRCGKCHGRLKFVPEESKYEIWTANPRLQAVSQLADRFNHE